MSRLPASARFRARRWRAVPVAAALLAVAALAAPVQGAAASPGRSDDPAEVRKQPRLHSHHTIFDGGGERVGLTTYHSFRIPALVRSAQGTLLAFAEGRIRNELDHGDIDVVLKRSTDNGRTWSPLTLVAGAGAGTWGNPTAVVDRETGRIFLFMSWNSAAVSQFGRDGTLKIQHWGQRRVFLASSGDDGRTWTKPRDLTGTLLPPGRDWDAIGPGNGIQTENGPHPGRLVVPALSRNIFSDDHGRTWRWKRIPGGTSEGTVLELLDGTLVRNDRVIGQLWPTARARWISRGTIEKGFSVFTPDRALPDARVAGSAIRYGSDPSRLVFLNPASTVDRCNMTVRLSYDEGLTWPVSRRTGDRAAIARSCQEDRGGYSSMAVTGDRMIGALIEFIETPRKGSNRSIEFHRFNLAWVLNGAQEPVRSLGQSVADDKQVAAPAGPAGGQSAGPDEPAVPGEPAQTAALPKTAPVSASTAPGPAPIVLAGTALLALLLTLLRPGRTVPWRAAALGAARQGPDSLADQQRW